MSKRRPLHFNLHFAKQKKCEPDKLSLLFPQGSCRPRQGARRENPRQVFQFNPRQLPNQTALSTSRSFLAFCCHSAARPRDPKKQMWRSAKPPKPIISTHKATTAALSLPSPPSPLPIQHPNLRRRRPVGLSINHSARGRKHNLPQICMKKAPRVGSSFQSPGKLAALLPFSGLRKRSVPTGREVRPRRFQR